MINNDPIFNKIAEALLIEYTSVYYVNAKTNEYQWYSADPEFQSLHIEKGGEDFFKNLIRDADKVVYEEDKHIFMKDIQKNNLMAQVEKGTMRNIEYRLVIDGKPVYHSLRLIRGISSDDDYFILGVQNVDKQVRERFQAEQYEQEREIYNQIAGSLAEHYDTLYYVNMEDDSYFEYSSTDVYKSMHVPPKGQDFFTESLKNLKKFVHPDDAERVIPLYDKQNMLDNLKNSKMFNDTYRLVVNGEVMHCRCSQIWASDRKHILVGIENINDEVEAQKDFEETKRQRAAYSQIVNGLASRYDLLYYVNISTGDYSRYSSGADADDPGVRVEGLNFFEESFKMANYEVHPEDLDRIITILDKDYIISALENSKQYSADYRRILKGRVEHTRLTIMRSSDNVHFILGMENIDEEVKKEQEQIEALNRANELARRDGLTGTRNMTAYREFEESIQRSIDSASGHSPFAIVICDINDLKHVNDSKGHKAGDEYIRSACRMICGVFAHSPVFRIGGDEFAAVLAGGDYDKKEALVGMLRSRSTENLRTGDGPAVAVGIGVYDRSADHKVSDVFNRADEDMYVDKTAMKSGKTLKEAEKQEKVRVDIPADRMRRLDGLFETFSVLAEGKYVYLCDMRYDYSRWSKAAVDSFGLPSEYMFAAGDIWEEHIHEEDREVYHEGIAAIFQGAVGAHDMQYRARKINGEYSVCTCKGIVLRDENGEPDYFCGAIRDHGVQSNIDSLTGLRNQYGFFEDIQSNIVKNKEMRICLVGIAKFSEINEIYGYHFGNLVLQMFGRIFFNHVGNYGSVYRLDGTKFAIMSTTLEAEDVSKRYEDLRARYRAGIDIDGRHIMLELNSGVIDVDNFNIDSQTVMTCLTFAYTESKTRRHGDLVEFGSGLNSDSRRRLEKLHAIRASITQGYKGFYLLYQPVVDAQTEKLIGAEALLRWRSEEHGVVPPDQFIPLLEQDPLFPDLGEWILTTAVRDAKKILETNPDFIINVNLSYTQLEKANFVDMVMGILDMTGFPPEHLCLEITERCRLLDIVLLRNIVVSLRGRGVKIALDDFGTGFSSVSIVKDLPFDTIKIDRSFVRRIEEDDRERELIKAFVNMATTYGAVVCIEGVETSGMGDILRTYDVHSFQGYYYAKPLELEDFLKWGK